MEHEAIFTFVYEQAIWGSDNSRAYRGSSGDGSEQYYNIKEYIPFLRKFIQDHEIKQIADLGCGNFKCGPLIYGDLDINYTGYDVYNSVILNNRQIHPNYSWVTLNFCKDPTKILPADLCILKDVLQHWSSDEIYNFLDYIVSQQLFNYIMICNCCDQKEDDPPNIAPHPRQLSSNFLPLKKYSPQSLLRYNTKEVCIIQGRPT